MPSPQPKRSATTKKKTAKAAAKPAVKSAAKSGAKSGAGAKKSAPASKARAPKAAEPLTLTPAPSGTKTPAKSASKPAMKLAASGAAPTQAELAREFCVEAARLLTDDKCRDVVVLDVRGRSQVTDFTIVGTGTSDRQMRSAGEHVEKLGLQRAMKVYRHNLNEPSPKWVILDFVNVVVHLFEPDSRLYYDIEMLWGDSPRVLWERPSDLKQEKVEETPAMRNRAGLRKDDLLR